MGYSPLILIELNELSPTLTERFIRQGQLPTFSRFYREGEVYVTEAEERAPYLEPWIQWITVHSGLNYREHGIFHLGDGHRLQRKCIWDLLSERGMRVWICGSMNIRSDRPLNGWILPDPWTTEIPPYPSDLLPYFNFVQRHVLDYTKDELPLRTIDLVRFVRFMATHGLSLRTGWAIVRQLLSERLASAKRWRRAVILDHLQFDLFQWYFRKRRPHFSTFFLNSTAHFQHFYWRNMEPSAFKLTPPEGDQAELRDAILFGYRQMDQLLEEFIKIAGKDTVLVLCTALSQQPCLTYEDTGGKVHYRPKDFVQLSRFAGIADPLRVSPVMAEVFNIHFDHEASAIEAEKRLRALRVDERPALNVSRDGRTLACGCRLFNGISRQAMVHRPSGDAAPFFDLFYQIEGMKSGMHHPDGMFWIRRPNCLHRVHREKLPLKAVFPKLLETLGVQQREAEHARPVGQERLAGWA